MIAGGGERLPDRVDGAAFDPVTSTWRMLPPIPLEESSRVTHAVWAGSQMIVVSREATLLTTPSPTSGQRSATDSTRLNTRAWWCGPVKA